ncbi:uncharacterized protein M421DRAFT_119087 [Didymella exigua CBS 183.55]|uniref:Uncharacterized protein n=1 Tax=Didymella exigua CBS 183.55 TaxID=1150837 RepID=A0A6A5S0W4_9PLEO|nr:uncharacterized protein M421DRAFT_119087 [Didymella exigua CBS 183.55]KAF1934355.1 hypothetical protein M421DRAFT_119087 [Didymella exigua CBS 183.55]
MTAPAVKQPCGVVTQLPTAGRIFGCSWSPWLRGLQRQWLVLWSIARRVVMFEARVRVGGKLERISTLGHGLALCQSVPWPCCGEMQQSAEDAEMCPVATQGSSAPMTPLTYKAKRSPHGRHRTDTGTLSDVARGLCLRSFRCIALNTIYPGRMICAVE